MIAKWYQKPTKRSTPPTARKHARHSKSERRAAARPMHQRGFTDLLRQAIHLRYR
jgi:hypothetical protein